MSPSTTVYKFESKIDGSNATIGFRFTVFQLSQGSLYGVKCLELKDSKYVV